MLTEEVHSSGVAAGEKVTSHEDAAHEKRNWVRLTFDCNNRCIFCLDSDTHNGEMRDRDEVKQQILHGREQGATRLILSGGEPTMHPNYVDFIKLGARAGYSKIQTVTNGRMFQYQDFMDKCLNAGLSEITFSLHGPNSRVHDALVGVKGAFEHETAGLKRALAHRDKFGLPIVNVDIVINRANVKHLKEMLDLFIGWGVNEFDLLQVVPFGRAFTEGRDTLFYDMAEHREHLLAAFAYCNRPDIHIWLNRFPPQHLEGFEHLIQDPYKLNDEVRGRKEEFARLLEDGADLDCRDEHGRCTYCYLEQLCNTLYKEKARMDARGFQIARVDTEWEAHQTPVFGGDPASARRAKQEAAARLDGKIGLPVMTGATSPAAARPTPPQLIADAGVQRLWLVAPDVARARAALSAYPKTTCLDLELDDPAGLGAVMNGDALDGKIVMSVVARTVAHAEALLALPASFEVVVELSTATAPWLLGLPAASVSPRLALRQPTHERLTASAERDVDLRAFFADFRHLVPVEGVPACVTGRAPRVRPPTLDTAMMSPQGGLEIFRYAKRYILAHYQTKSLRCRTCVHDTSCAGMHVNYVRAHGFGLMQPIPASPALAAAR